MIYTFALVPAPLTSPVTTDTSYVFMRAVKHLKKKAPLELNKYEALA